MYATTSLTASQTCHHFSIADIQFATNDFDDELVIGKGGFGKVYYGHIRVEEATHTVAIKRLDSMSDQGAPEFKTEIEMLSKLRHCHLVSLIGFCDENKEMILVYEYMPHGTLYDHLHSADTPLNWVQRLKIAIGAGRGLDYLHTGVGTQHGVIHRDVKSSNILLDENWAARISDFGLSKVSPINQSSSYIDTSVKGTFGYLDPEYFYTRKLTRKTDVYAFGVVLFELLSGKFAVDTCLSEEHCSLVRWAQKCVKDRKLDQIVDLNIRGTISPRCLRRFAQIANRCLNSVPKQRPSMTEVVSSLQALLELQGKHADSAEPSSIMGFPRKIHKYLVFMTKQNSDGSGTSSHKSHEKDTNLYSAIHKDGNYHVEIPHPHGEIVATDLKIFTYSELKRATRKFEKDTYLGDGRYAKIYKGWVHKTTYSPSKDNTELPIAVKRLHHYKHFDLEMLKEFNHPNIVKLIGYCVEQELLFLVYEFMPNGNFEDGLESGLVRRLPLATKVKIAIGIARGIVFLHKTREEGKEDQRKRGTVGESWEDEINFGGTFAEPQIDRHKILLDEDFTAKLSDYDITKIVHGQYPESYTENDRFHDDEYYFPGCAPFHLQSNLSGFNVLFTEVLLGRKVYNPKEMREANDLLRQKGEKFLFRIAKLCFEICNVVDAESKMLTILEDYVKYIP